MCEFKLIKSYVLESSSGVFDAQNSSKHFDVTSYRKILMWRKPDDDYRTWYFFKPVENNFRGVRMKLRRGFELILNISRLRWHSQAMRYLTFVNLIQFCISRPCFGWQNALYHWRQWRHWSCWISICCIVTVLKYSRTLLWWVNH